MKWVDSIGMGWSELSHARIVLLVGKSGRVDLSKLPVEQSRAIEFLVQDTALACLYRRRGGGLKSQRRRVEHSNR